MEMNFSAPESELTEFFLYLSRVPFHVRIDPEDASKCFARNSYESLFFKPAVFPLRHRENPIAPNSRSPAMVAPTAIPAFALVEMPLLLLPVGSSDTTDGLALDVGTLKSSVVTLKQGT
jgi:hypothetical protein